MNKPTKHFKRWRVYSWKAAQGEVIPVESPLPAAAVKALGLVPCGSTADGKATAYMKTGNAPDTVKLLDADTSPAPALLAADNTPLSGNPFEGLRQVVADACDVDNRRAGGQEYYAEKYPAFVKMSEREHEARQRAAIVAASDGSGS